MTPSPLRRTVCLAFMVSVPMIVMGCPKKPQPAVEDAGPPPPASTPEVTELGPLVEDAGPDADAAEAGKKWGGGGNYNPNQLKIKACCNAMHAQAKALGNAPEAAPIVMLATQCDVIATQVGPQGNAPEFNQLRQMLKSVKLPAACSF